MNELHRTMPAMADAWTAQNQKFLGANSIDSYHLLTKFPVHRVEDLRGRKILAPGPAAAWLEGTGAVAVDGGFTTTTSRFKAGVADGVVTILTGARRIGCRKSRRTSRSSASAGRSGARLRSISTRGTVCPPTCAR